MNIEVSKELKNDFIHRSFRDQADCDYIAARASNKIDLFDQFLWSGLQAIEKYLKAILLYYERSTKSISHDLTKALELVEDIPDIKSDFSDKLKEYVEYFSFYGNNRYFEFSKQTEGYELLKLDYSVWSIRRYCQDLSFLKEYGKEKKDHFTGYINWLRSEKCKDYPQKFRLYSSRGHLEEVLDTDKFLAQRRILIWKNRFYGKYKKHKIKLWIKGRISNPTHYLYPHLLSWLKENVRISEWVRNQLEEELLKYENSD